MAGLLIFIPILISSCGGSETTGPEPRNSGDEEWFGAVDNSAVWVDVDDDCYVRIKAQKDKADSVCQARGYSQAAGYDPLDCWVGGVKDTYIECVACTYNN